MPKHLIAILLLLLTFSANGQSFRAILFNPNVYRTQVNFDAVRLSDQNGNVYNDEVTIDVEGGYMDYKIVSEDESGYIIIRILPKVIYETIHTPRGLKNRIRRATDAEVINIGALNNGYHYNLAIKKDDFPPLAKTLLTAKIVGVPLVHPFRLRPGLGAADWDIQSEFSVSYSFGVRLKVGKQFQSRYLTLVPFGFGVGSAKYFKNFGDEEKDGMSITYYQAGLLYTVGKINLGAFIGFDAMISRRNDWFYQGNSWYSFGLGYKFND